MDYTIKDGEFYIVKNPEGVKYIRLSEDCVLSTIHDVEIITEENYKLLTHDTEQS